MKFNMPESSNLNIRVGVESKSPGIEQVMRHTQKLM